MNLTLRFGDALAARGRHSTDTGPTRGRPVNDRFCNSCGRTAYSLYSMPCSGYFGWRRLFISEYRYSPPYLSYLTFCGNWVRLHFPQIKVNQSTYTSFRVPSLGQSAHNSVGAGSEATSLFIDDDGVFYYILYYFHHLHEPEVSGGLWQSEG